MGYIKTNWGNGMYTWSYDKTKGEDSTVYDVCDSNGKSLYATSNYYSDLKDKDNWIILKDKKKLTRYDLLDFED